MSVWQSLHQILSLSCERASRLLSKSQDTDFNRTEHIALRFHLKLCKSCRRYSHQLAYLRAILSKAAKKTNTGDGHARGVTPEQKKRVMDYLRKHLS